MPHYQKFLIKNPDLAVVTQLFRETILDDEQVVSLESLTVDLDTPTRTLSLSFEATLSTGEVLEFSDFILGENL